MLFLVLAMGEQQESNSNSLAISFLKSIYKFSTKQFWVNYILAMHHISLNEYQLAEQHMCAAIDLYDQFAMSNVDSFEIGNLYDA